MSHKHLGKLDPWIPGPFVAMTEQICHDCRVPDLALRTPEAYIPPGATAYRCADGWVRCAVHRHRKDEA